MAHTGGVPHHRDQTGAALEAARAVGGDDWRDLMQPARNAAARLVDRGEMVVTQGGTVVDPVTASGPIRIGRAR